MLIIPNLHPLLVHFTIALTVTSFGTGLIAWLFKSRVKIYEEGLIVSRWCLWLAALAALATVGAGFHAYFTVGHDAVSHQVMKTHRNWALVGTAVLVLLALYSVKRHCQHQKNSKALFLGLFIAMLLVMITGWYGAELVYRYGLGVMSLPEVHGEGHDHHGAMMENVVMTPLSRDSHENHDH